MPEAVAETDDVATLHERNRGYVRAAQDSDVKWYADHLDAAYMSFNPDGSLVDKAGYIERIARPGPPRRYEAVDSHVRVVGDLGIIQSGFRQLDPEGKPAMGCYTDVWSRVSGRWLCISAHFALFGVPMRDTVAAKTSTASSASSKDHTALDGLNRGFIRSVRESDAQWFDANLDEDFLNTNGDGSLSGRAEFLATIARPCPVANLSAEDVRITVIGDSALVRGRTRYAKPGGEPGIGRYTDLWQRRQGRWLCTAAHVTRG
jgi:ketosteroid isomerase-like protein